MTLFDDIQNEIDAGIEDIGFPTEGYHHIMKASDMIDKLREEYAPTVEMTKKQYHSFKLWKYHTAGWNMTNCAEWARDEHLKASEAMEAWLHPETIKIVDE